MKSKLYEGMTRTQSPRRGEPSLRLAALSLLCASLLLALGWAAFSPLDERDGQQAQAQTPEPEPSAAEENPDQQDEPSYAAFGESKDPFALVVQRAEEGGGAEGEDSSASADETGSQTQPAGDEMEDQERTTLEDDNDSRSGDDAQQRTTSSAPPAGGGAAGGSGSTAGSGAGNVNCQNPADEFEEILCEEGATGATPEAAGGTAWSGDTGEVEDDRYGGSGRSGAGEPTETFRNGGPAPGK